MTTKKVPLPTSATITKTAKTLTMLPIAMMNAGGRPLPTASRSTSTMSTMKTITRVYSKEDSSDPPAHQDSSPSRRAMTVALLIWKLDRKFTCPNYW
jgi:hypothetical protein